MNGYMPTIHLMQPEHTSAVCKLLKELADYHEQKISVDPAKLKKSLGHTSGLAGFVAVDHVGDVVGFCLLFPIFSSNFTRWSTELHDLYISDEYRKMGLATQMLNEVAKWSQDEDQPLIYLDVVNWNSSALKLYEKLGGEILSTTTSIRGDTWYRMVLEVENIL